MSWFKEQRKRRKLKKAIKQFRLFANLCNIPIGFGSDKEIEKVAFNLFEEIWTQINYLHIQLVQIDLERQEQNEKEE